MSDAWKPVVAAGDLPAGRITPVTVGDHEAVIWRTRGGEPCVMARWCPHLDWDLTEAVIIGDELLCPGHGWTLRCDGLALKRNERGREDPKGAIRTWPARERDGWIEIDSEPSSPDTPP